MRARPQLPLKQPWLLRLKLARLWQVKQRAQILHTRVAAEEAQPPRPPPGRGLRKRRHHPLRSRHTVQCRAMDFHLHFHLTELVAVQVLLLLRSLSHHCLEPCAGAIRRQRCSQQPHHRRHYSLELLALLCLHSRHTRQQLLLRAWLQPLAGNRLDYRTRLCRVPPCQCWQLHSVPVSIFRHISRLRLPTKELEVQVKRKLQLLQPKR